MAPATAATTAYPGAGYGGYQTPYAPHKPYGGQYQQPYSPSSGQYQQPYYQDPYAYAPSQAPQYGYYPAAPPPKNGASAPLACWCVVPWLAPARARAGAWGCLNCCRSRAGSGRGSWQRKRWAPHSLIRARACHPAHADAPGYDYTDYKKDDYYKPHDEYTKKDDGGYRKDGYGPYKGYPSPVPKSACLSRCVVLCCAVLCCLQRQWCSTCVQACTCPHHPPTPHARPTPTTHVTHTHNHRHGHLPVVHLWRVLHADCDL
jgi:hypothetical protein